MTPMHLRHPVRLLIVALALVVLVPLGLTQTAAHASSTTTTRASVATGATHTAVTTATTSRTLGRKMMKGPGYRWTATKQWSCLNALWTRESGWQVHAGRTSGSYGIPQANPGRKMGTGWRDSASAQIAWGLKYIKGRYTSPCRADAHQRSAGWY